MEWLRSRTCLLAAYAVFVFTATGWGQSPKEKTEDATKYSGSEACQSCHEELFAPLRASAHGVLFEKSGSADAGCEACHGAGAEHVNSGGDRAKIFRYTDAGKMAIRKSCTRCHAKTGDQAHASKGVTCLGCHAAHRYQENKHILVASAQRVCQKCHSS